MEISVWSQLFAQVASFLSRLLEQSSEAQRQANSIESTNAQDGAVPSISISRSSQTDGQERLTIVRRRRTETGVFGVMSFSGDEICATLENAADLIQPGIYNARLDMSPHLGYVCPHLQVPERDLAAGGDAGLRVHVANFVSQLLGCVAVGLQPFPDHIEQSQAAFDKLMAVLPQTFEVEIC